MSAEESLSLVIRDKWKKQAACRGMGPEHFYLDELDPRYDEKFEIAKRVCSNCPVSHECGSYASGRNEEWGIWDGVNLERLLKS